MRVAKKVPFVDISYYSRLTSSYSGACFALRVEFIVVRIEGCCLLSRRFGRYKYSLLYYSDLGIVMP